MASPLKVNLKAFENKKEMKRHKVNDGDNVFRFLPPFGDQADGYPYRRWSIAWLIDPQSGRQRPYASPWSFQEKECPVGEYTKQLQAKRDILEKTMLGNGTPKKEVDAFLKPMGEVLYKTKPKSTFFYNAINKSGEVGVLEIKKTAQDILKKQMKEYISDYNQDPTSLNSDEDDSGVWFKVNRSGEKNETKYSVEKRQIKKKNENGKVVFEDDQEPLPEHVVENYSDYAYDLFSLYRKISYEDLYEVLISTLSNLYAYSVKEYGKKAADNLKIEGFEFSSTEEVEEESEEVEEVVVKAKPTAVASKKPMPKFDDEDDDEEPLPKAVQKKPKKDEFLDMAADLLDL